MQNPKLAGLVSIAPHKRQGLHRHPEARLILFLAGELREESFAGEGHFAGGDILFRPPFYGHADETSPSGARYVRVPVSPHAVRDFVTRQGWCAARGNLVIQRSELRMLLSEPFGGDALLGRLNEDAYRTIRATSPMRRAAEMLMDATPPRLDDLAESLGLKPYELSRRFQTEFGIAPRAYRSQARLQRAMKLLADDAVSLVEIAPASGYCDQSHLTRALKRETGLTPLQFRVAAGSGSGCKFVQ